MNSTTLKNFLTKMKVVEPFHLSVEDLANTMLDIGFEVDLENLSYLQLFSDEIAFNRYVEALKHIVNGNYGTLHVEKYDDRRIIICSYNDLILSCEFNIKEQFNIHIERKNEKEDYIYNIGYTGNPHLFLILNIEVKSFNQNNFRYSLDVNGTNVVQLFLHKKDAISEFRKLIGIYTKDIGKIELSSVETKGTLIARDGSVIALLKNDYESDDIKVNYELGNMNLFIRVLNYISKFDIDKMTDVFSVLGFNLRGSAVGMKLDALSKIYRIVRGKQLTTAANACTIAFENGYRMEIKIIKPLEPLYNAQEKENIEPRFEIRVTCIDNNRTFHIPSDNFQNFIVESDFASNNYTFKDACMLIKKVSEYTENTFKYTLLVRDENGIMQLYRYDNFEMALYAPYGFMAIAKDNDFISLDVNNRVGKSYKVRVGNGGFFDYVYLDKNDGMIKVYGELMKENPNYSSLLVKQ